MNIIKRNGEEQLFDEEKIKVAIQSANKDCTKLLNDLQIDLIVQRVKLTCERYSKSFTVEDVQNLVEEGIMAQGAYEVAKKYITYRYKRKLERDKYNELISVVKEKLRADNVQNQNANVDEYSFSGRMGEATNVISKEVALTGTISKMAKDNHYGNMIYIHDLDHYEIGDHNCLSIPFDDLFANGFEIRQTDIRPARSVDTAFQLLAVIFQLQSLQQFGGVSATHLDHTMIPYVRISFYKHYKKGLKYAECIDDDNEIYTNIHEKMSVEDAIYKSNKKAYKYAVDMTKEEIRQGVEGMFHNLNSLQSRAGGQLPFTSINYGTCTLTEGRWIIQNLLEVNIKGIGKQNRTPIFPCSIFQCMKGVNRKKGEPNYDMYRLALKCTSKRLYPNYANVDWSGNAGYDVNDPRTYFSTMGCRTANGWDINGFGQLKDGRGNICPVTIIMPTLAMQANGDVETFMNILETKINEAKDMLIERFEWICSQKPNSAKFMYKNNIMAGYIPEEGIRSALKHGTLAVGQLGLSETLKLLIGCDHTTEKGMKLAKRIEALFRDKCAYFKEKYKLNFGVYYTPAENLCYTAMKKFKEKYGVIEGVSDKEYFTNSIHVPVDVKVNAFEKIDIEAQLTGYSSAGCITYIELDSSCQNNIDAVETLVNYAMDKDIPYFAINVPNDQCMNCGYTGDLNDECVQCGSKNIKRLRRVTGYLTNDYKTAFNLGKQQEVEKRVKHM